MGKMGKVNYQQIYKVDHTKFGGLITGFDFDGHPTMKNMADRISSDRRFDNYCRYTKENMIRKNNYKKENERKH